MADCDPSNRKHRMVRNYRADDEFCGGNSSTGSPTTRSCGSHNSQLHGNKGFDMIESFFSTIFGGCCRPNHCSDGVVAMVAGKKTASNPTRRIFKVDAPGRQRWEDIEPLPRPPRIRRIALDDEFTAKPSIDRSESLSFLFNQGGHPASS